MPRPGRDLHFRFLRSFGRGLKILVGFAVVSLAARLAAQPQAIPAAEIALPPSPARVAAIHAAAQRDGWAPQVRPLLAAAEQAYQAGRLPAAEAWYYLYRWADLFGQKSKSEFEPRWVAAVNAAKVGHSGMSLEKTEDRPLGLTLSTELQAWLLGNAVFSEEFFTLLTPVDYVPRVFAILDELYRRDAARFKTYANLALALAVVCDVPPPPHWPHGQVTAAALPRKFPAPAEAFAWWIKQEQAGRTYHRLSRLGAEELKFVVDVAAPFAELEWAQQAVPGPLAQLPAAYAMIRYRTDRVTAGVEVWPGRTYKLADILAAGGICADQAYFATQAGKARGVPTLLFYGAGNDGRHAWFGYLDSNQQWQMDAGRYAEQRFVTGLARDPQTWMEFSDHELRFLGERFRSLPSYRQSRVHATFAASYLTAGKPAAAAAAARKAVNYERRNAAGWEALIGAAQKEGRDAKTVEALLREAALAFQRHPDLEAFYTVRVSESLRARGETSAAEEELRRIARRNETGRSDLSVQQARNLLAQSIATQTLPEQIRAYNSLLGTFGQGAGIGFFDEVVITFVTHLVQLRQPAEAARALERARQTLKVEPGGQLDSEFRKLGALVKLPVK